MATGQRNNSLFLICFPWNISVLVHTSGCVCVYTFNRTSSLRPTELHSGGSLMLPCCWVLNHHYNNNNKKDTVQTGKEKPADQMCSSVSNNFYKNSTFHFTKAYKHKHTHTLFNVSIACRSHLLQQFISFRLQHEGEIGTLRRVLDVPSFLLLQICYHLSNIQSSEKHG